MTNLFWQREKKYYITSEMLLEYRNIITIRNKLKSKALKMNDLYKRPQHGYHNNNKKSTELGRSSTSTETCVFHPRSKSTQQTHINTANKR